MATQTLSWWFVLLPRMVRVVATMTCRADGLMDCSLEQGRQEGLQSPSMKRAHTRHTTINVILLILMAALGLMSIFSSTLNILSFYEVIDFLGPNNYASDSERAGALTAFLWIGGWAVLMTLLCPVAAAGLWLQREWGRKLAIAVWAFSIVGCCCTIPACAYGLWSLTTTAAATGTQADR